MSTNLNNMAQGRQGGTDYGNPQLGAQYARLIGYAYTGVHENKAYKGQPKPPTPKVILTFELLNDFITLDDGSQMPRHISKKENAFSSENANLTKIFNTLDPTNHSGGDFGVLVRETVPCILTIAPKVDGNGAPVGGVKIAQISACPAGTESQLPPVRNTPVIFDFENPTPETYAGLKKWQQEDVKKAEGFASSPCAAIAAAYDAQVAQQQAAAQAQGQGQQPAAQAPVATPPAPTGVPAVPQQAPAGAPPMPPTQGQGGLPLPPPPFAPPAGAPSGVPAPTPPASSPAPVAPVAAPAQQQAPAGINTEGCPPGWGRDAAGNWVNVPATPVPQTSAY